MDSKAIAYIGINEYPSLPSQSSGHIPILSSGKLYKTTFYPYEPIQSITDSTILTISDSVVLVDATSAAITVTLPPQTAVYYGKVYNIKKIDSSGNSVTIDGNASELIDNATTQVINSQYDSVTIVSDGIKWWII